MRRKASRTETFLTETLIIHHTVLTYYWHVSGSFPAVSRLRSDGESSLNISKSKVCVSYPKGPPGSTATVAPCCSAFPRCFKRSTHTTARSAALRCADGHTWGSVPASALHGTGEPLSDRLRQLTAPNSAADGLEEEAEERRIQQMFSGIWPRPKLSCEQTRAVWVSLHVFILNLKSSQKCLLDFF